MFVEAAEAPIGRDKVDLNDPEAFAAEVIGIAQARWIFRIDTRVFACARPGEMGKLADCVAGDLAAENVVASLRGGAGEIVERRAGDVGRR